MGLQRLCSELGDIVARGKRNAITLQQDNYIAYNIRNCSIKGL
jgi:hypothetical protein